MVWRVRVREKLEMALRAKGSQELIDLYIHLGGSRRGETDVS